MAEYAPGTHLKIVRPRYIDRLFTMGSPIRSPAALYRAVLADAKPSMQPAPRGDEPH